VCVVKEVVVSVFLEMNEHQRERWIHAGFGLAVYLGSNIATYIVVISLPSSDQPYHENYLHC
jgi:hypothetical protein